MSERVVHWSDWAGQPDIKIACGGWTTPAWKGTPQWFEPHNDTHPGHDGRAYTFAHFAAEASRITCAECRQLFDAYIERGGFSGRRDGR